MKRIIVILAFLITFSCQKDDQIIPKASENRSAASDEVPGQPKLKDRSANARIGGHPYWYFYRGTSTSHLRYAYSDDGVNWGGNQTFNNDVGSSTSPAVVIFNNKFYAIYKGGSTTNIYVSSSVDGINWQPASPGIEIAAHSTNFAPTAVVLNGYIFVYYVNRLQNNDLYYITSGDGDTWSSPRSITNAFKCSGPVNAFVSPLGEIYLYYTFDGQLTNPDENLVLQRGTLLGGNTVDFEEPEALYANNKRVLTSTGVSVVWNNDALYLAYKKPGDGRLNIYKETPTSVQVFWTNAYTSNNPSLVFFDNKFTIVYKSLSSTAILYGTSANGQTWSSNHAAIGQTTAGGPRMIAE